MLFPAEVLKLLPLITTLVPTGPDAGVNELITGTCACSKDIGSMISKNNFNIREFIFIKKLMSVLKLQQISTTIFSLQLPAFSELKIQKKLSIEKYF
jgi:hypothetical protein